MQDKQDRRRFEYCCIQVPFHYGTDEGDKDPHDHKPDYVIPEQETLL